MKTRLEEHYLKSVHPAMVEKFNYKNNYILLILVIFSVYCSIKLVETWDQHDNLVRGKITLEYL